MVISTFSLLSIFSLLLPLLTGAADPDPLQDFCVADLNSTAGLINGFPCRPSSSLSVDDFFFSGLTREGSTRNRFKSNITSANVLSFPALNTLGLSMNRVVIAPGGINPLHSHPRATEAGVVVAGTILAGFLTTSGEYISKTLEEGEMFVFPRGLVHFQENIGKSKAVIITAFNSQLAGVVILSTTVFGSSPSIPPSVIAKSFNVNHSIVSAIRSKFGS